MIEMMKKKIMFLTMSMIYDREYGSRNNFVVVEVDLVARNNWKLMVVHNYSCICKGKEKTLFTSALKT